MLVRFLRIVSWTVAWIILLAALAWAFLAIHFDAPPRLRTIGVAAVATAFVTTLFFVRGVRRKALVVLLLVAGVIAWWERIPPSNERDWLPDVAQLPRADIDGDRVTIHNLRNFDYRSETDYTEHWETRTFDLSQIRGFDMFLSYWGPTAIAHTISSWDFGDGGHLAISIETRKEKGETYSALLGFFRQYELYYVVADERDVIGVRTNHRGEHTYLYRLRASPERARHILLDYLATVNQLAEQPQWYNAMTHNCTTTIRDHVQNVTPTRPWGWQLLLNGYLDQLGYQRGTINNSLPFPEIKARSEITQKAIAANGAADFSERIRDGLPERPAPPP